MDVFSVVTFYNQFRLNPPGRYSIRVCLGTTCHIKGGYIALDAWKRRLGIEPGETTEDRGMVAVSHAGLGSDRETEVYQ
jgi:NADH-quinone oxidoreductase subunit E